MALPDMLRLKVEMQSLGVRLGPTRAAASRAGGAGPADGITVLIDDLVATVPTNAPYVERSPFSLRDDDALLRDGEEVRVIGPAREPEFYSLRTRSGTPMRRVALRHGLNGIGSTVAQSCVRRGEACQFCGIAVTRQTGETLPVKRPDEIAEVCTAARGEGFEHIVLTTGTTDLEDCGIPHLSRCAEAVKNATEGRMKVHVQFEPPVEDRLIRKTAEHADSVAINMECFDPAALERVAPGKAAMGIERYERAWHVAVDAFGAGRVACFIIAGLGEAPDSVLKGCELLSSAGVYPFVLPLRPIPGTPMESWAPPSTDYMLGLYQEAASIIGGAGLSSVTCPAGCVRCSACSAITDLV